MIRTAKVVRSEVATNKDGDTEVRLVVGELTSEDDLQSIEYYDCGGRDYRPPANSEIVVLDISPSFRIAIAVDDTVDKQDEPDLQPGEQELYSTDGGTTKESWQRFLATGQIEINGRGDFAVRFNELNDAMESLRDEFNAFVDDYNGHVHGIPPIADGTGALCTIGAGPLLGDTVPSATTPPNANHTTLNISNSKVENVEFEGDEPV